MTEERGYVFEWVCGWGMLFVWVVPVSLFVTLFNPSSLFVLCHCFCLWARISLHSVVLVYCLLTQTAYVLTERGVTSTSESSDELSSEESAVQKRDMAVVCCCCCCVCA